MGLGTLTSILLAINGFFIRALVKKIDEAAIRSQSALTEIASMKKDVGDIPGMKTDIAVIKNTLEHKNELSAIYKRLGEV